MADKYPETLTMNTRSMSSALRDLATLLERGRGPYVVDALRSLADRVEQMARDQGADA